MCSLSIFIFSDFDHVWKSKQYVGQASPLDTNWPLFANEFTSGCDHWGNTRSTLPLSDVMSQHRDALRHSNELRT